MLGLSPGRRVFAFRKVDSPKSLMDGELIMSDYKSRPPKKQRGDLRHKGEMPNPCFN